jgi:uncharacterized Ntn-hydrolase superfamily protein
VSACFFSIDHIETSPQFKKNFTRERSGVGMTFSILALDRENKLMGGAAATGNLCVGGWVLRADARAGVTASQGIRPSTVLGVKALEDLARGEKGPDIVRKLSRLDSGRAGRQLSVLDQSGRVGLYSGRENLPYSGGQLHDGLVVSGNMLVGQAVIQAMVDTYRNSTLPLAEILLECLAAGAEAGGDFRGLQSAALIIVSHEQVPLDLRIDDHSDPIGALKNLYSKTRAPEYCRWIENLPTLARPEITR